MSLLGRCGIPFPIPFPFPFLFQTLPPLLFSNHSSFSSFLSPYLLFTHPPPFHFPSTPNLYKTMQRRSTSSVFSRQPSWTQLPRLEKTQLFPLFFLNLSLIERRCPQSLTFHTKFTQFLIPSFFFHLSLVLTTPRRYIPTILIPYP